MATLEEAEVAMSPDVKNKLNCTYSQPSNDNRPIDLEATLDTPMENSEAAPGDQLGDSKATLDRKSTPEAPPSNDVVDSEASPNNGVVSSEMQTSNDVVESEKQHNNERVLASETQPTEAEHNNEEVVSEPHCNDEVAMSEVQPSSEVVMSDSHQSNEVVFSDTQPSTETVMHEAGISNDAVVSDTQPNNDVIMYEAQISNDVVASEARPENELANLTVDPNNRLSHQEILLDNHQFDNLHTTSEYLLPPPEPLPDSGSPTNSEPVADSHDADDKPIPHNHLQEYDTHLNNHLDHHEALANHQLANSETLSPDQLANSQMMTHYDLGNSETLHDNRLVSSQAHYEMVNANNFPSYEIVNAETSPNNEEHTPETQPSKKRKKKSIVWEHFTIETVSPDCRRACCKECKQTFAYSTGSKVAGTSHLKRHIAKGACPALLRSLDPNQHASYTPRSRGSGAGNANNTPKRRYRTAGTPYIIIDQDRCRHEIARMIIMHDYPLHMVEHPGFVAFVQNLQPQFNMVTFNTIQGDCVATYLTEKQCLTKYFDELPGRVGLTLDMWTSSQSVGYVFITGHFVDSDWKLQRRLLNVVMEPCPDSDSALSHAVSVCISDWNLEGRLFTITCNQPLSKVALENLRPLLSVKNPLIFDGQLLIGHCIARTLSNVAYDLLSSTQGIVNKIRESVKYVKTSESHEDKFLNLKQHLQVPSEKSLFIDDQTKWNTTYQMLVAASELKEVFSCLDTSDPDYKGTPSVRDWKLVEILCTYLKPLYDAANILTTTTYPTAITFFHEVWKLHLDLARAVTNEDPFISDLTKPMHEKIDKYWRDCSLALVIAVVMDPRFKMKLVEFSFTKIYGEDAHGYVKIVDDGINELFHEYATLPLPLTPAYAEEGNAGSNIKMEGSSGRTLLSDNGLTDFDAYIMETSTHQTKSELDQYLEESLLPRVPDFDVLGWWKLNKLKYPTLSKMARDILSIPVSTVPSDSIFDKKSKEMDQYRSSLRPETVEALVCAKDWMQYGAPESLTALVKMEF
ncbi:putative transcription factor/ chromatin remodeling BED-type(Zn) family [Medicago truncatula]|uniref:Putative transcription factor/ chromatin remodeling BED-type(Zn) family n=1 Tax=Medicago truncatula TaxID=3880 RepID=A0A396H539_MEDTR|nr:zinc finger BED domain-containing protein DAYSLEEPER-like [Medicago truncatula]XP_039683561.1 zinc finger BED domain-containing protein DAYSLEEPER-like [Medicago truncatula]XP_039683562.1 zinc finger BED domain-containing protein DAYSLEEPER-like [Medicago truncatula]RHN48389.1 putative transcription factor/ chromatin remodeling BED-type(Zn) family [Medicago truncatula]